MPDDKFSRVKSGRVNIYLRERAAIHANDLLKNGPYYGLSDLIATLLAKERIRMRARTAYTPKRALKLSRKLMRRMAA